MAILAVVVVLVMAVLVEFRSEAAEKPFENLFQDGFAGYMSHEKEVLTEDYISSQPIAVSEGEKVWFGPCAPAQYYHLIGRDSNGKAATGKIRGKELTIADKFNNGSVIYEYTVPAGISQLVYAAPAEMAEVYSVSKTEMTELVWRAYWSQEGKDTDSFVGPSSYYSVSEGDKLYFGALTKEDALRSKVYDANAGLIGTIAEENLREVENFGGAYGIYCYTAQKDAAYVYVTYDADYEQYYRCFEVAKADNVSDETIINDYVDAIGITRPLNSTVERLKDKTALFLGDSITFGARDRANIYGAGSWAGRIGYYAQMKVTNNGVSGACITTARRESSSEAHYIYNNLIKAKDTQFDYVIMHGLFNDSSEKVAVGTPQGKANFKPDKADVSKFADALELLFYQARVQNPDAILGFIVNFQTDRTNVDQTPYVDMAIKICKDWGIQYLDLYHMDGFKVEFDDGLHPSSAGYDSMYTVVANWMATLKKSAEDTVPKVGAANVMSYNIFWDKDIPKTHASGLSIENRYEKVAKLIKEESPDIILLQEFRTEFASAAASILSEYTLYGAPHDDNEMSPVAWKTAMYDKEAEGTLQIPGNLCDSTKKYPRTVSYVVLKDKASGKQLLVMSVHGQPDADGVKNDTARTKMMELVAQKAAELSAQYGNCGVIIGGDLNTAVGSDAYEALTDAGFVDIRAAKNPTSVGSYNDWTRDAKKFAMGDYLFYGGDINADFYQVITDDLDTGRSDGKAVHLSDHSPIVTKIYY